MKDYESVFIGAEIKSNIITWHQLSNDILLGYAALCFQKIAKKHHNYEAEPLLEMKKSNSTNTYFIVPTEYLMNLVKQSAFFSQYFQEGKNILSDTRKTELSFKCQMKDIENSYLAYEFMHECYRNEIYSDEIEDVLASSKPYFDLLEEKRKIEKIVPRKNIKTKTITQKTRNKI